MFVLGKHNKNIVTALKTPRIGNLIPDSKKTGQDPNILITNNKILCGIHKYVLFNSSLNF